LSAIPACAVCVLEDAKVAPAPMDTLLAATPDAAPELPVVMVVPDGVIPSKQLHSVVPATGQATSGGCGDTRGSTP
jgi:hypothetical protein